MSSMSFGPIFRRDDIQKDSKIDLEAVSPAETQVAFEITPGVECTAPYTFL
jgi:hypothetical protein